MTTSYEKSASRIERRESDRRIQERNWEVWDGPGGILDSTDQTPGRSFFEAVVKWANGRLTRDAYDVLCATSSLTGFADKSWHRGTVDHYLSKVADKLRDSHNWSADRIRDKVRELSNRSKPEIRAYLAKIQFMETVNDLDSARDFLQRHRLDVASRQYFAPDGSGPFPRLMQNIVPPGFVTSVPLDAKYLNELASQDVAAFQRMCRRYHISQINRRLEETKDSLRSSE